MIAREFIPARRRPSFSLVVLAITFLLSGCGDGPPPVSETSDDALEDRVVVYSPHGREILSEYQGLFEEAHPGTEVEFLYLSSRQCLERVRGESANPGADIWWGAGHTTFMTAAEEDLLEPYAPAWSSAVSETARDAESRWHACFLSPEIIFYNSQVVEATAAPKDWADLADPRFEDQVLMRFPLPSDTMRAIFFGRVYDAIQKTGDPEAAFEWMAGLDANTKEYLSGGEQVFRKMAQRVGSVSVWTLSDIMLQRSRYDYPFEIVYPESGSPVILDGIAMVKSAAHPKAAKAYYEFVTSIESAVRLANEPYYRIPTRTDIPKEQLPEWMRALEYTEQELDWSLYTEGMNGWMKRWDEEVKGRGKTLRDAKVEENGDG